MNWQKTFASVLLLAGVVQFIYCIFSGKIVGGLGAIVMVLGGAEWLTQLRLRIIEEEIKKLKK